MPKKPQFFNIQVPVKSYVKLFLELNYGDPVNFERHPEEYEFFMDLFKNKCRRNDSKIKIDPINYQDSVEIRIPEDFFYRHGWELTRTNALKFSRHFETRIKFFMRIYVGVSVALGLPLFQSIRDFQTTYNFTEDDWKYEAIKKDFYRHAPKETIDFKPILYDKIKKIILENLYDSGTITHLLIKNHETNS